MKAKHYQVNEIFYSLQGEGARSGSPNVFVRFAGCNMLCRKEPGVRSPGGFDCDTEFSSGRALTAQGLLKEVQKVGGGCKWIILTGGEPALQLDALLIAVLRKAGYHLAIETNGTIALPPGLDWITISPKTAEHSIRQRVASEVKYVRALGQALPRPTVAKAEHYYLSPAFDGCALSQGNMDWCVKLCKENPKWKLNLQIHKLLRIR